MHISLDVGPELGVEHIVGSQAGWDGEGTILLSAVDILDVPLVLFGLPFIGKSSIIYFFNLR